MTDQPHMLTVTEARVQRALWYKLRSASRIVMPNYTPMHWWECDLWSVTRAGYMVEHEIKLSFSDFRADARKTNHRGSKHARLALGDIHGPTRFWFVFPAQLIEGPHLDEWLLSAVPAWAGIKVVWPVHDGCYLRLKVVRPAPRLHAEKVDHTRILPRVHETCYYRYWTAIVAFAEQTDRAARDRQSFDRQLAEAQRRRDD